MANYVLKWKVRKRIYNVDMLSKFIPADYILNKDIYILAI